MHTLAVLWIGRLGAGFFPWRPGLKPVSFHTRFTLDSRELQHIFLQYLPSFPPIISYCSVATPWGVRYPWLGSILWHPLSLSWAHLWNDTGCREVGETVYTRIARLGATRDMSHLQPRSVRFTPGERAPCIHSARNRLHGIISKKRVKLYL
jgi:hypothetical protein